MKAAKECGKDKHSNLLLTYRSTPHTTTNETPAENHNRKKNVMCEFKVEEAVMARSNTVGAPKVKAVTLMYMYGLETNSGSIWKTIKKVLKL